jgi:hypothetical protein
MEHPMRWLSLVCLFLASVARGEIIIDDFDDPASAVSPAMGNVGVVTPNVGELNALRTMRISSPRAEPTTEARMIVARSLLTAEVIDLHADNVRANVSLKLDYDFAPADLTSGNAFVFDVKSVMGPTPPPAIRVLIFDPQHSYFATFAPVPVGGSFSAVLPFADFVRSDGVPHEINFGSIRIANVDIFANGVMLGEPVERGWTVEIDRLYVGTVVPEPEGLCLLLLIPFFRRRTCAHSG